MGFSVLSKLTGKKPRMAINANVLPQQQPQVQQPTQQVTQQTPQPQQSGVAPVPPSSATSINQQQQADTRATSNDAVNNVAQQIAENNKQQAMTSLVGDYLKSKGIEPVQQQTQTPTAEIAPTAEDVERDKQIAQYRQMIDTWAEDDKKAKDRHRKGQTINALFDGLTALANLVATGEGAPSMNLANTSSLRKSNKYFEDARKRRLQDRDYMIAQKEKLENAAKDAKRWREHMGLEREKIDAANKREAARAAERAEDRRRAAIKDAATIVLKKDANDIARKRAAAAGRIGRGLAAANKRNDKKEDKKTTTRGAKGGSTSGGRYYRGWNGKAYHIDKSKYTEATILPVYDQIPKEFRKERKSKHDQFPTSADDMVAAIETYLDTAKREGSKEEREKALKIAHYLWERVGKPQGEGKEYSIAGEREGEIWKRIQGEPNTYAEWTGEEEEERKDENDYSNLIQ